MKIFISWSGEPSRSVAVALRDWIPYLLQSVEPWMSESDLEAGVRWSGKIQQELSETKFGIVCVTPTNMEAPWLLFESGALAKTIQDAYLCPYLIGVDPTELKGPLAQFQAKRAQREGTRDLVHTVNKALGGQAIEGRRLDLSFERWWPDLERQLASLPESESTGRTPPRTQEDMLEEILLLARNIEKQTRIRHTQPERSLADIYGEHFPGISDSDSFRSWLTHQHNDRDNLKAAYILLRDTLASLPREARKNDDDESS